MTEQTSLPPCDRFTLLDWRESETPSQCDVCDLPEASHASPGRRVLSGGEIEELRRRLIVERYDTLEKNDQSSGDGAAS